MNGFCSKSFLVQFLKFGTCFPRSDNIINRGLVCMPANGGLSNLSSSHLTVWLWVLGLGARVIGWLVQKTGSCLYFWGWPQAGCLNKQEYVMGACSLPCSASVPHLSHCFSRVRRPSLKQRPSPPHSLGLFTSPLAWVHSFWMHQAPESCQLCLQPLGATGEHWKERPGLHPHPQYSLGISKKWFANTGLKTKNGLPCTGLNSQEGRLLLVLISEAALVARKEWWWQKGSGRSPRTEPSDRCWLRPLPQGECLLPCQRFSLRHWNAALTGGGDCLPPVADLQVQLCLHAHLSLVSWELHLKRMCKTDS